MNKIIVREFGGPEELKFEGAADPQPTDDEALVHVEAAGINYVDVYQRKGVVKSPLPFTPGFEGTGTIKAIGSNVSHLRVGQRVGWINASGSYAEAIAIPAGQAIVLPESFKAGQGLLFQAVTAQYLIAEYRVLKPGDWVIVHAAAGGVGQILVQWAKHLGATVIATASTPEKIDRVRSLGADHVIDYSKSDFQNEVMALTAQRGVDVVFDGVGQDTFERSVMCLTHGGTAVNYGQASGPAPKIDPRSLMAKSLRVASGSVFGYIADGKQLHSRAQAVLEGIKSKWLDIGVPSSYPLRDAARAHSDIEGRKTQGKLMLAP